MVKVFYAWLSDLSDYSFHEYLKQLPGFMKKDIMRYRDAADQKARLLARLILKNCLVQEGYGASICQWEKDNHHKPYIKGWKCFNISHSGDLVLFSYGDMAIGIDVEKITTINFLEMMQYFHGEEQLAITKAIDPKKTFYEMWVRKEALLKATGVGIGNDLHELNCTKEEVYCQGGNWYLLPIFIHPEYPACLCMPEREALVVIKRFLPGKSPSYITGTANKQSF